MPSITCARREHMRAGFHQPGDGFAVARAFQDEIGNQRHGFRVIELDAALEPAARHHRGHGDQQLVFFARASDSLCPHCSQSRGNGTPSAGNSTDRS